MLEYFNIVFWIDSDSKIKKLSSFKVSYWAEFQYSAFISGFLKKFMLMKNVFFLQEIKSIFHVFLEFYEIGVINY